MYMTDYREGPLTKAFGCYLSAVTPTTSKTPWKPKTLEENGVDVPLFSKQRSVGGSISFLDWGEVCANLVRSDRCPSRCAGSSFPFSCPFCSGSCRAGSAWAPRWRSGIPPWLPGPPPYWSCSPCPRPRTASSCGTWCCTPAPADTARWPSRSPAAGARRAGAPPPRTHLECAKRQRGYPL